MFINPQSFFTSWAVQLMWLLEGPPREEIFPAALCTGACGADSKPRREQRSPGLSHRSSLSWPPGLCQGDWTQGSALAPQPPLCPHLLQRVILWSRADSGTQGEEYFPNKGREGEGSAWPTAGCRFTKHVHLQRFCF